MSYSNAENLHIHRLEYGRFMIKIPTSPPSSDFPSDVFKFIKLNAPTSKMSIKLMKVCKYFLHKTFSYLYVEDVLAKENCLLYKKDGKFVTFDLENLDQLPNNLCLTKTFSLFGDSKFYAPLLSKVVKWEIKELKILFDKELTLEEFKFLIGSKKLKNVYFGGKIVIKNDAGEIISFEETLKYFSQLAKIEIQPVSPIASIEKFKALQFPRLKWFGLHNFDENFDFKAFKNFVLSHQNVEFEIHSWHKWSEEYTKNFQFFVDIIIKHWYSPIALHISFEGQSEESKILLKKHLKYSQRFNRLL